MTDFIFEHNQPMPRALLSDMHQDEQGEPTFQIRAYYYKDARRRGLKLSINRTITTPYGFCYDLLNDYNGLVHLADMPRKPSPKVAQAWADMIAAETDRIAAIALASNKPDWKQIAALFANVTV
jgi:hypothetical protein